MVALCVLAAWHRSDMQDGGTTSRDAAPFLQGAWGQRVGILEKKMETTIVYWGYMGIMENKMETTIILGVI